MLVIKRNKSEVISLEITRENLLALANTLQPAQSLRMAVGVVHVCPPGVRIGLEFPREFEIHREEIEHTIHLQQAGLKNELTATATLKGLHSRSIRDRMQIRRRERPGTTLTQQPAAEPPCSLCGRPLLRCACHGDCVGRAVPAAESSTAMAGAAS